MATVCSEGGVAFGQLGDFEELQLLYLLSYMTKYILGQSGALIFSQAKCNQSCETCDKKDQSHQHKHFSVCLANIL